ncbi:MAG: hypothetical protein UH084_02885 [Paludibacteraceae bacterium]|nr:hypothetical protein [Paludibacteraceae bacterium]
MKLLATIKSVKLARQYQRQDGTYANIFGVTLESGDDTIMAETFLSKESQQKRGIVPGAIGNATVTMSLREWTDRQGNPHTTQEVRLADFALANRHISTESAQAAASEDSSAVEQPAAETAKETLTPAEQAQVEENTQLPF